jgi:hypothetical protein
MGLLGLELSDAGILVAGGNPPALLRVDGTQTESPGFAVPEGNRLLVGTAAQKKAHLNPVQVHSRFWDQLNTKRLKSHLPGAGNHAEIAFAHLAFLWQRVGRHGDRLVMAVPGFVGRYQMGLILSMCEELALPLQGVVSLPVASTQPNDGDRMIAHVDIHLHRLEVSLLQSDGDRLTLIDSASTPDHGLLYLCRKWVESIGAEFVRTTRFDPLHRASSEQELYDRLPLVLSAMEKESSMPFVMNSGGNPYKVKLSKDLFMNDSETVFWEIRRLLAGFRARQETPAQPLRVQITHRIRRLPGWEFMLRNPGNDRLMELEVGSGALGVLTLWEELTAKDKGQTSFIASRPWRETILPPHSAPLPRRSSQAAASGYTRPTHVLYRHRAYRITEKALVVGKGQADLGISISLQGDLAGVSKRHCSIQLQGEHVVLTDHSTCGTFVDRLPVGGTMVLKLGQVIHVGTSGERLDLIAVENDGA